MYGPRQTDPLVRSIGHSFGEVIEWRPHALEGVDSMVARGLEHVLRGLRRRSRLRPFRPGSHVIDIPRLISPLRYDVIVRSQLFSLLDSIRDESAATIAHTVRQTPYFVWFRHVECQRFAPHLLRNPDQLDQKFRERVMRALATLTSFEATGFDPRHPVTLVETQGQQVADSGAVASQELHIADGCHRLALLLRDGQELAPEMYRTQPAVGPPLDNTAILLRHLDITEEEYARFLSHHFADKSYADVSELRRAVAGHSPESLTELDRVLEAHSRAPRTGGICT
jgi:hypothetical protein